MEFDPLGETLCKAMAAGQNPSPATKSAVAP